MANVLAPLSPDHDMDWTVRFLARLHSRERIRVHLLSVQPPYNGHVRMYISEAKIRAIHREDAELVLAPMRKALDAHGVPYNEHVAVGYTAEEIARLAQDLHCRQIVIGPPRGRGLSQLILGSLTRQVEHLMSAAGTPCEVL